MNHPEDNEQRVVCQWLEYHKILFAAVPNGGKRNRIEAAIMKGLGVKAGVPDLLIFTPPPHVPDCRGVAIEMKRKKGGRLSEKQAEWLASLTACGWYATVCHGADEAIRMLEELGYSR